VFVVQWLFLGEVNCSYGSGCRGFKIKCSSVTQKVQEQVSKSKVHFVCSCALAEYVLASHLARDSAPYLTIVSMCTLSYYFSRIALTFGVVYPEILSCSLIGVSLTSKMHCALFSYTVAWIQMQGIASSVYTAVFHRSII
jgi:hypothetical protein